MKLNRRLQRQTLERLREAYPERLEIREMEAIRALDPEQFTANLYYLQEHGLIESSIRENLMMPVEALDARITARGLDFLEDDGGLDAILRTVTVRFEADSLRDVFERHLDASNLDQSVKSTLRQKLRSLPAEALQQVVLKMLDSGLAQAPGALQQLGTLLGQFV